ncbi:PIN domain-containing protein [Anabaena catenula]|uniref:Type II toxin-antitoxin system VapC family toxin n=1 Tax=Anabaena catenula FACHB-362 TaxID=2692877 RepID=A0ABR8J3U2_9NOST|nr:type II toxin-antitoxin system VapC family toxin [Anabaena catenula FACHB-362]
MRDKIFVDTLFIVALINKRDQYHQRALELAQQCENYPLITTDAILLEVGNALSSNYKSEAVELMETFLNSDDVEVIRLNPDLFEEALNLYKQHQDKSWGLVDCVSFVVMKQNKVTQALTFDTDGGTKSATRQTL